ncbi:MAG: PQQ-like beta-propeller repeat protein [Opitutaceae bacterium]|nr:PQQ-like beta-propeller repeat protein [Opitutaceae bacterium]
MVRVTPLLPRLIPALAAGGGAIVLLLWLYRPPLDALERRIPGTDHPPGADVTAILNPVLVGSRVAGDGQPATLPGNWAGFRGQDRSGIGLGPPNLARSWDASGPRELWSVNLGEGYGGAAVFKGRVYLLDYDQANRRSALRCLSLTDGREIWRYAYALSVKRNHGMSRTVPTVTERFVVAMDPKCNVVCLDTESGELRWGLNLVREFGATIPPWYAGQCPLVDGESVILAPGGNDALMIAVELATGKPRWKTPNPRAWKMTHSSIMPMDFAGQRIYLYCGSGGVAAVSAQDGRILWDTTDWKISIATVPSPLVLPDGKIFLSGGYNAGSLMLQLAEDGGRIVSRPLFRLPPEVFGATQHSPVFHHDRIFGIRASGHFVCLDLNGKVIWSSGSAGQFGLGPFLVVGDLIYAMNDSGNLTLLEASAEKFTPLAKAQVLKGRESWAPMALAGGRLLARDLTRMVCLDVAAK